DAILASTDQNFGQPETYDFIESDHRTAVVSWARDRFGDQIAPNGKPAWQNFARWFGDSKVVDENGEPLVVYHGTKGDFAEFQLGRADRRDGGWFGDGFYLTASQDLASSYAMRERDHSLTDRPANVMPVYVRMSNPYRINLAELSYDEGSNFTKKYGGNEGFRKWLADNGYDGVIGYRDPEIAGQGAEFWEVVVFDPTQIKSATGNRGTFDPGDSDIRYSRTADAFTDLNETQSAFLNKIGRPPAKSKAKEWLAERLDRAGLKVRQGMVDRYAALKEMDEKLHGKDFIDTAIHDSSWVLAKMSSAASGALTAMMTAGRIRYNTKERVITLQDDDSSGGLTTVLSQLGSAAEVERFMGWIAANRAHRLAQEGREHLFSPAEIEAGRQLNQGATDAGKSRRAAYAKAFAEFQKYRDDVLTIAEENGIISAENRAMWKDEFYVPFYRVMAEEATAKGPTGSKGLSRQEAYKKLKGGRENLNDLLENTLMNFHHLLSASLKNQAAVQSVKNAEKLGIAEKVSESARDPKTSTFVLEKGERVFYEVSDPLVYEAITILADPGLNNFAVRAMGSFKRLLTQMVTITPQFITANTMRDLVQATATTPTSFNVAKNIGQGIKAYRNEKTRAQMLAAGGAFSFGHIYGMDASEVRANLNRTIKGAKLVTHPRMIPDIIQAGWRAWGEVTDTSENISRAASYVQNVENLGQLRAAFEARDIMDFSQHGAWPAIRFLIRVVPFLNARLQGLDKIYRSGFKPALLVAMGQGTASDKQAAGRFAAVTGALTLASLALYMANKDDEEYQKLEEWQKDTYWFFRIGDNAFFVPKPFEVGAIATLAERTAQQFMDDKATGALFRERMTAMLMDTFSFNPVPQMFQPALDVYANKDSFTGRAIETPGMDRLSPGLRARDSTTAPARALSAVSRLAGDDSPVALSPVQADHLISGYLGSVGASAAGMIDTIWRTANGQTSPDKRWSEYQPIRRFYRDLGAPAPYTRYSTLFYEGLREANRVYADVLEMQKLGRHDEAQDLATREQGVLALRRSFNQQQRRLTEINQRIQQVRRSDWDGARKRQELDRLMAMRNLITEQMGRRVEDVRAAR
ncbi:MAG: LPD38 domain-containing protein, partial [Burkholderiaceae bacterium]